MEIQAYLLNSSAFSSTMWYFRLHQLGTISKINTYIHLKDEQLDKTETREVSESLS